MLRLLIGVRLLPNYKRNYFSELLQSGWCLHTSYSSFANHNQTSLNDSGIYHREIDVDLLIDSCTNARLAKCLHTLLIVLGKVQSLFISTRLINLHANLACRNLNDGKRIHSWISKTGLEWDVFVAASLVHMYCRFGLFDAAYQIFRNMPFRDMACWNAIISGFCQNGKGEKALEVLDEMKFEGIKMDSVTVSTILPVCAQMDDMPDASVWGALLGACRIYGNAELGKVASDRLLEVDPDNVGYYVLLSNIYANAGFGSVLEQLNISASVDLGSRFREATGLM
ncbi:hypothetical protein L6452_17907 [Arctium lappa]|uniref:Uncharacterized protein n=1 Tax=Arctium lappa TaxID=4217 RepID=A0ACB9C4P6_ARCLA|nr:hypothetical protein L6452_17907 [Arctium lappa]